MNKVPSVSGVRATARRGTTAAKPAPPDRWRRRSAGHTTSRWVAPAPGARQPTAAAISPTDGSDATRRPVVLQSAVVVWPSAIKSARVSRPPGKTRMIGEPPPSASKRKFAASAGGGRAGARRGRRRATGLRTGCAGLSEVGHHCQRDHRGRTAAPARISHRWRRC